MRIIHETPGGGGAILRMQLQVSENLHRVLFQPGEWNSMVRTALYAGGMKWIDDYLPLRFTNYARTELGYSAKVTKGGAYTTKASNRNIPLVQNGDLRNTALSQSWAEAKATSSNARVTMHIATGMTQPSKKGASTPYGNQPLVYRTLTTITEREIGVIAATMEATLTALVAGSEGTISRKGTIRRSLTPTQHSTLVPTKRTPTHATKRAA